MGNTELVGLSTSILPHLTAVDLSTGIHLLGTNLFLDQVQFGLNGPSLPLICADSSRTDCRITGTPAIKDHVYPALVNGALRIPLSIVQNNTSQFWTYDPPAPPLNAAEKDKTKVQTTAKPPSTPSHAAAAIQ